MAKFSPKRPVLTAFVVLLLASGCGSHAPAVHRNALDSHRTVPPTPVAANKVTNPGMQDFDFVDAQHGYGLAAGKLLYTTDAGRDWSAVPNQSGFAPTDRLDFLNVNRGWYLAPTGPTSSGRPGGLLSQTTDGGHHWRALSPVPVGAIYLHFWSPQTGVIIAPHSSPDQAANVIPTVYRTTDGGLSWQTVGTLPEMDAASAGRYLAVSFPDPADGWAVVGLEPGAGSQAKALYRTSDGGRTWLKIAAASFSGDQANTSPTDSGLPLGWYVSSLSFRNDRNGYLSLDRGPVLGTTDGGQTWQPVWTKYFQPEVAFVKRIQFVDANDGWLLDESGSLSLWGTTAGGGSWQHLVSGSDGASGLP